MKVVQLWKRPTILIGLLIIASSNPSLAIEPVPMTTLSEDTESGYGALADIQEGICRAHPTHPCVLGDGEGLCAQMDVLGRQLFPNDSPDERAKLQVLLKSVCSVRGTPFELPGLHWLLQTRLDIVSQSAQKLNLKLPDKIIFGALPAPGVNAEVQVESQGAPPIILVNINFLEFANELSKLAAQTIPFRTVQGQIGFRIDEQESIAKIQEAPEFRRYLIALIDYFRGRQKPRPLRPSEISRTIQIVYDDAIETFAMAHEVGHIYYKHPTSTFDFATAIAKIRHFAGSDRSNVKRSVRELEADGFAVAIILRMTADSIADDSKNRFVASIPQGVEFYFIAQQILDEAALLESDAAGVGQIAWSDAMKADVPRVATCYLKPGCRVRDLADLNSALREIDRHPPHRFRAEVMRWIINHRSQDKNREWTQIADLVNRNVLLLWRATRAEYLSSRKAPQ